MQMSDPMSPFFGPSGRRAVLGEVRSRIQEKTGAIPVCGFSRMLEPGDSVTGRDRSWDFMETVGQRQWLLPLSAARGMSWCTAEVPKSCSERVLFFLSIGFGSNSPLPQPSGQWDIFVNDRWALSVRVVNHSQLWRRGPCILAFSANRIESAPPYQGLCLSSIISDASLAASGPALLTVPTNWVRPNTTAP